MPDTSAAGREANDRSAREAADKVRQLEAQGTGHWKSQDEMRRRQIRIDKMAAMLYVSNTNASESYMVNDLRDAVRSVERAIALAAAVDKALGIAP